MPQRRRHFTPEQKAVLLRRHLVDKVPVSTLCNENDLQPSVLYGWLHQLLTNAPAALSSPRATSHEQRLEEKVQALEARLARKDAVIAEVSEELVKTKKALGEP